MGAHLIENDKITRLNASKTVAPQIQHTHKKQTHFISEYLEKLYHIGEMQSY